MNSNYGLSANTLMWNQAHVTDDVLKKIPPLSTLQAFVLETTVVELNTEEETSSRRLTCPEVVAVKGGERENYARVLVEPVKAQVDGSRTTFACPQCKKQQTSKHSRRHLRTHGYTDMEVSSIQQSAFRNARRTQSLSQLFRCKFCLNSVGALISFHCL